MMATIDEHIVLKGRRDLIWQAQADGWAVYDPLARCGFRCGQAERWLFCQFDGRQSLSEVHRAAALHTEIQIIAWREIAALADTLLRRGLVRAVSSDAPSDSNRSVLARSWGQWFSQSVSWRMRGVNPERLLKWLAPRSGFFLSPVAVRGWITLMFIVGLLVLADFERLVDQARLWQWLIKPASGSALFAIFIITRAVHELGHALVLTRFGGRSPDVGVIFMLGAPCVYCDVTESWRLPHAWQRAAVAAGGMLAESIVATLAAIVWLITVDGTINTLALQTMIVCSISTWLVNANPLMRFDGYYILSDWCDEPNLRQRADQCAMHGLKRWLLGRTSKGSLAAELAMSQRRFVGLSLFSILGFVYRLSLSWMMASVIVAMYATWHFEMIGKWIAVALLACWWGVPAMKLATQLVRSAKTIWARARLSLLTAWTVLMIAIVPFPSREHGTGWVQPVRMQGLYAPQTARLERIDKHPGARVQPDETIFQLDDDTAQLRHVDLARHAERAAVQLVALTRQVKRNLPVDVDLRAVESSKESLINQAEQAAQAVRKLSVKAEIEGKLISLPAPKLQDIDGHALEPTPQFWLDVDQCGRVVPQGTMLAAVCSREQLAVVPLGDVQLRDISEGTSVRFYLPSHSQRIWQGNVHAIVRLEQLDSQARLVAAAADKVDASGQPLQAANLNRAGYAAVIELPMQDASIGCEVQAVFTVPPKTLASRMNDWLHNNLRWMLD